MPKTICFTGPKPKKLCGYNHNNYKNFVKQLTSHILNCHNKGYTHFISGGAQGFDQLAFWAVHQAKQIHPDIQNILYKPFINYGNKWAEQGPFSKNEYILISQFADSVKIITPSVLFDKNEIIKALLQRNKTMIDDSDCVMTLSNTDDIKYNYGGTSHGMQYTLTQHKPVFQLKYETTDNKLMITDTKILT